MPWRSMEDAGWYPASGGYSANFTSLSEFLHGEKQCLLSSTFPLSRGLHAFLTIIANSNVREQHVVV
jgi:hypothetical protein